MEASMDSYCANDIRLCRDVSLGWSYRLDQFVVIVDAKENKA